MKLSLKTKQIFPPLEMDGKRDQSFPNLRSVAKSEAKKAVTWNAKCPIFLGNFTPKTSNYCLKNRALGFPGSFREGIYTLRPHGYLFWCVRKMDLYVTLQEKISLQKAAL